MYVPSAQTSDVDCPLLHILLPPYPYASPILVKCERMIASPTTSAKHQKERTEVVSRCVHMQSEVGGGHAPLIMIDCVALISYTARELTARERERQRGRVHTAARRVQRETEGRTSIDVKCCGGRARERTSADRIPSEQGHTKERPARWGEESKEARRKTHQIKRAVRDVLAPVHLDKVRAEVLGHLLKVVWPVPVRRDAVRAPRSVRVG